MKRADERWERESDDYAQRNLSKKRSDHLVRFLERANQPFSRVLHVGCSTGDILASVVEAFGCEGVGVEPGAKAVELARMRHPKLRFEQGFAQDLPFADESFDLVIFAGVVYWVPRAHVYQAIGETLRVSSRFVLVGEFAPATPYSSRYRDADPREMRTFKVSTVPAYTSLGLARLAASDTVLEEEGEWGRRGTYLYEKVPTDVAYPLREQSDFGETPP